MANDRKKEIFRLLKEEYKEQIDELETLEKRVLEQREIVKSTQVQLVFYEKYLDNGREKPVGQIPLDIKEKNMPVVNQQEYYGIGDIVPDVKEIKVLGDQVVHLLKYNIRKASPYSIIEEVYKGVMNLPETRTLQYAIRNKTKHGNLLLAKFNNSLRYSFAILPDWVDEHDQLKSEFWPLPEHLPKIIKRIEVIRSKK